ncbi:hypothetical protein FHG87_016139 [Trinorchestia longiramus]|nr:hypothetical protein FHG87_016139 [Trinorchestia longiramus]
MHPKYGALYSTQYTNKHSSKTWKNYEFNNNIISRQRTKYHTENVRNTCYCVYPTSTTTSNTTSTTTRTTTSTTTSTATSTSTSTTTSTATGTTTSTATNCSTTLVGVKKKIDGSDSLCLQSSHSRTGNSLPFSETQTSL